MAELSLKDRLQPALLDRLTDDERMVTIFRLTLNHAQLRDCGLTEPEVERALGLQGLMPVGGAAVARDDGGTTREYVATGRPASQVSPRALRVRAANGQTEVPLTEFCKVEVTAAVNPQLESADRRAMSMSRLRAAVLRDLGWLFNASGMDDIVDLEPYPEVRRSVLNYGLRSLAGRSVTSIDPMEVARRIRDVIGIFEPRLSNIRVTPETRDDADAGMTVSFLVEAELWGQPLAQQLSLRTSIDVGTGDVIVADRAGRA
jgi:type VI secretion system protein ImpF